MTNIVERTHEMVDFVDTFFDIVDMMRCMALLHAAGALPNIPVPRSNILWPC
jgi:hypothetical protein